MTYQAGCGSSLQKWNKHIEDYMYKKKHFFMHMMVIILEMNDLLHMTSSSIGRVKS